MSIFSLVFKHKLLNSNKDTARICTAVLAATLLFGGLHPNAASAQDRRIVTIDDADFFGSDYRTVKDVDLEGCKSACLKDNQCRAFTFNTSAGWCFLKTDFGELQSFSGAIAGRVVAVQAPRADMSADRRAELNFVPEAQLESAKTYSLQIVNSVRGNGQSADVNRRNGLAALNNRNGALAESDFCSYCCWNRVTTKAGPA